MLTFFQSQDFDLLGEETDEEFTPLTVAEIAEFRALDIKRPSPFEPIPHYDERLAFARRLAFAAGGAGVEVIEGEVFAQREFRVDGRPVAKIGRWTDYDREGVYRGWYAAIAAK